MTPRRSLPGWFAGLLIADLLLTVLAAVMLIVSPGAFALVAVAILAGGGAVAGARALWRRGAEAAAMALAMLPMVAGVPYVFATFGLPF